MPRLGLLGYSMVFKRICWKWKGFLRISCKWSAATLRPSLFHIALLFFFFHIAFPFPYCFSFSILLFLLDIQMILRFLKEFLVFEQHGDPPSSILPCFSSSIFLRDGLAKSIYIGISLSCSLKIRCDVYLTRSIAHGYVAYFFIFFVFSNEEEMLPPTILLNLLVEPSHAVLTKSSSCVSRNTSRPSVPANARVRK